MVVAPGAVLVALYAVGAILAAVVLWGALHAYRLLRQPFLQNFVLGLALLEASYLAVLLNRLVWPINWGYHTTLWVHELTQLAAFALLASSYRGRGGRLTAGQARRLQVGATVALPLAVAAFLLLPRGVAWSGRDATAAAFYLLAALPLAYVLLTAARGLRDRGSGAVLVPAGFAVWAAGQGLWMAWAVSHDWQMVVLAHVAFVGGLGLLAASLLPVWRRHGVPRAA